jgi:hypothetical protein
VSRQSDLELAGTRVVLGDFEGAGASIFEREAGYGAHIFHECVVRSKTADGQIEERSLHVSLGVGSENAGGRLRRASTYATAVKDCHVGATPCELESDGTPDDARADDSDPLTSHVPDHTEPRHAA